VKLGKNVTFEVSYSYARSWQQ